jgi:D-alanyl-D-alanine carboxypeptidase
MEVNMKKGFAFFVAAIMAFGLAACGKDTKDTKNVAIDYGKSDIYSKSDMDAAIELIEKEFSTWEGCELHSISYTADECNSEKNIEWMNNLGDENIEFTQCIEFVSDFHSPKDGGDAWDADSEYTNWEWWLARADSGEWNLMTWGY